MNKPTDVMPRDLFEALLPLLEDGQSASFRVSGMSMWPFLCHNRDAVVIRKSDVSRLQVGDIVLLKVPVMDKYLLHRVTAIRKSGQELQTTGDSNCFRDGWFPAEAVLARVVALHYRGREIPVTNFCYRLVSTIWCWLYPLRRPLLKLLLSGSKLLSFFRKRKTSVAQKK